VVVLTPLSTWVTSTGPPDIGGDIKSWLEQLGNYSDMIRLDFFKLDLGQYPFIGARIRELGVLGES